MKIIFSKTGEYRNDDKVVIVSDKDIEDEKVFTVCEKNAMSFIKAGLANLESEIKADPKFVKDDDHGTDIDKMTVPQLETFAAGLEPIIDLGDAKTKPEKLEIIRTEIDIRKAALEASQE